MNTKITMAARLVRLISQINSEQMAPINVPTVRTINLISALSTAVNVIFILTYPKKLLPTEGPIQTSATTAAH